MFETFVKALVYAVQAYAAIGVVFALLFVCFGIQRLDSEAQGSGIGFRLLIMPGVAAFWPLLVSPWVKGATEPPVKKNPH